MFKQIIGIRSMSSSRAGDDCESLLQTKIGAANSRTTVSTNGNVQYLHLNYTVSRILHKFAKEAEHHNLRNICFEEIKVDKCEKCLKIGISVPYENLRRVENIRE